MGIPVTPAAASTATETPAERLDRRHDVACAKQEVGPPRSDQHSAKASHSDRILAVAECVACPGATGALRMLCLAFWAGSHCGPDPNGRPSLAESMQTARELFLDSCPTPTNLQ